MMDLQCHIHELARASKGRRDRGVWARVFPEGSELEEKNAQEELFKKHIELAAKVNKPLMIHARPSQKF